MTQPQGQGAVSDTVQGAANPAGEPTKPAQEPVKDDVQAKIEAALAAAQETWKKEIAGLNRANSEMQKKLQEKELEGMKAEERVQKELEMARAEKDKILSEALSLKKQNAVVSKGLDPEFANLISGTNDDEINASLTTITSQIEKEVAKRLEAETNKRFGGKPPMSGTPPTNTTLQSQFDAAKKSGNIALANAIQRQASRDGVNLNI